MRRLQPGRRILREAVRLAGGERSATTVSSWLLGGLSIQKLARVALHSAHKKKGAAAASPRCGNAGAAPGATARSLCVPPPPHAPPSPSLSSDGHCLDLSSPQHLPPSPGTARPPQKYL